MPALLTAVDCDRHVHLIVGDNPLAAARCSRSIQVGATPKLVAPAEAALAQGLKRRIDAGEVLWIKAEFQDEFLTSLGREEVDGVVDAVFVTLSSSNDALRTHISSKCRRLRIPVNVTDSPSLSSFTLLSTHSDGPLHIGVTASGKGCKLATRVRREVAAALPPGLGAAVERLGELRRGLRSDPARAIGHEPTLDAEDDGDDDAVQPASFNSPVRLTDDETEQGKRMRVISQICEYWPLKRLAALTDDDVADILASCSSAAESLTTMPPIPQQRSGSITLAGSGPGHPALLTVATLRAIRSADVILADKLVPAAILDLVPRRARVAIARKFPGRSADAQDELQTSALAAAQAGANVLRLKQGDPFMFARGADEALWFRERGFPPRILPGLTSALVAPLAARVAVTSRGVADHVVVASGTATGGAAPRLPGCLGGRTAVLLMALHRLRDVVAALTEDVGDDAKGREGAAWPTDTPCVVVERASCRDQRVVRTSLRDVCAAVDELGSRPPGLLIVGAACETLTKRDGPWTVEEGCDEFEHFADWAIGDAALWTQGE